MAVSNYNDLVSYVTDHMEMDVETIAQIPTFVQSAEREFERLLTTPDREQVAELMTVAGERNIALPSDLREINLVWVDMSPAFILKQMSPAGLLAEYLNSSGQPAAFALVGSEMHLGPVPDDAYTLIVNYIRKIDGIGPSNLTNWLLTKHPDVYVYGTLWHAAGFRRDIEAASAFRAVTLDAIAQINQQSARSRITPSLRLQSPVVV